MELDQKELELKLNLLKDPLLQIILVKTYNKEIPYYLKRFLNNHHFQVIMDYKKKIIIPLIGMLGGGIIAISSLIGLSVEHNTYLNYPITKRVNEIQKIISISKLEQDSTYNQPSKYITKSELEILVNSKDYKKENQEKKKNENPWMIGFGVGVVISVLSLGKIASLYILEKHYNKKKVF